VSFLLTHHPAGFGVLTVPPLSASHIHLVKLNTERVATMAPNTSTARLLFGLEIACSILARNTPAVARYARNLMIGIAVYPAGRYASAQ
jgi:hypothetical protein